MMIGYIIDFKSFLLNLKQFCLFLRYLSASIAPKNSV